MDIVSDFDFRHTLNRHGDVRGRGIRAAGMRAAIGGTRQARSHSRAGLDQFLPVSQEFFSTLGKVFILGLLPYIID